MKNILYIIIALLIFSSCDDNDFDSRFDKNPNERITEASKRWKDLLTSSEFGWTANYYTSNEESSGASTLIMKFDQENRVDILGDHTKKIVTSEYVVKQINSTVLSFSSYNENLTWLTTPDKDNPKGLGGEIEFVFISSTENEIILEGMINKGKLILKKADKFELDFDYLDFMKIQFDAATDKGFLALKIKGEKKPKYGFTLDGVKMTFLYNENEEFKSESREILSTLDGIELSDPILVNGVEITSFKYTGKIEKDVDGKYVVKEEGDFVFKNDKIEVKLAKVKIPAYYNPQHIEDLKLNPYAKIHFNSGVVENYLSQILTEIPAVQSFWLVYNYTDVRNRNLGTGLNILTTDLSSIIIHYELIEMGKGLVKFVFNDDIDVFIREDIVDDPKTEINEVEAIIQKEKQIFRNSKGVQNMIKLMSDEKGFIVFKEPFLYGYSLYSFISVSNPENAFVPYAQY